MKKTFIAASVLGLFVAGSVMAADQKTQDVPVTFHGSVQQETCTVQVGTGTDNRLNLGVMKAKPNAKGAVVPVMFRFADCSADKTLLSIQLTGALNSGSSKDKIAEGTLGTEVDGVTVQLMTDPTGTWNKDPVKFNGDNGIPLPESKEPDHKTYAVVPYYAQMKAGVDQPGTGEVATVGLFTVTYK